MDWQNLPRQNWLDVQWPGSVKERGTCTIATNTSVRFVCCCWGTVAVYEWHHCTTRCLVNTITVKVHSFTLSQNYTRSITLALPRFVRAHVHQACSDTDASRVLKTDVFSTRGHHNMAASSIIFMAPQSPREEGYAHRAHSIVSDSPSLVHLLPR